MLTSGNENFKVKPDPRRLTDIYITIMLLVFPLFTGFSGYSKITESKYVFFLAVTGLWLIAAVAPAAVHAIRTHARFRPTAAQTAVLLYFALCVVSSVLSPYGSAVLLGAGRYDGLLTIFAYVCIFLGVSSLGELKDHHIFAFAVSVSVCCAVAFVQLFAKNALQLFPNDLLYYDADVYYSGEFLGTIGNTDLLSGFLCLAIPLFAALFITDAVRFAWVMLIPACLGCLILAVSHVSGGAVALICCALVAAPFTVRSANRLRRAAIFAFFAVICVSAALCFEPDFTDRVFTCTFGLRLFLISCVVAAAVCSAVYAVSYLPFFAKSRCVTAAIIVAEAAVCIACLIVVYNWPGSSGTIYELCCVLHGKISDEFGSHRIQIWRRMLELFRERPLFGGGPDTISLRSDITFSRYVRELGKTRYTYVDNAHNEYLGHLVNTGMLSLAAYLGAIISSLLRWIRGDGRKCLLPALGCSLFAYWVQSFFGLGLCIAAPLMWVLWGLFEAREKNDKKTDKDICTAGV